MTDEPPAWQRPDAGATPAPQQVPPAWGTPMPPPGWGGQPQAPKPGVIALRPLGLTEVLDGAIATMRRHPGVMIGFAAVVVTVSQVLTLLASWLAGDFDIVPDPDNPFATTVTPGSVIAIGIMILVSTFLSGCLTVVVGRAVVGRPAPVGEVLDEIMPRLPALLLLTLIYLVGGALIGGVSVVAIFALVMAVGPAGAVLGLIIGLTLLVALVWLWTLLALAGPALVLERSGPVPAMKRSIELVRGSWWRIFAVLLLANIISGVIALIIELPFAVLGGGFAAFSGDEQQLTMSVTIATSIGVIIANTITLPFVAGVTALLYTDQRMRKEGLDIVLARSVRGAY